MVHALSRLAVAVVVCAGVSSAHAADAVVAPVAPGLAYFGERSVPFTVYDYEPGIYLRAYWSEPWGNRRYFPITGKRPKVGRDENLHAPRHLPPPAKTFYREWSTSQIADEVVPATVNPPPLLPVLPAPLPPQK